MANGILRGAGTQADPWLVEDAWDLDALRNLPLTTWQWIEITENIDLRPFPNWTPIPNCRFNIDGKNHKIQNFNITGTGSLGLFLQLETHETKDIILEGEITNTATSFNSTGMFASRLICGTMATGQTEMVRSTISNIQCFGSLNINITGATGCAGGCFGEVYVDSQNHGSIESCVFHGSIAVRINNASSTSPSATQCRVCGGIVGTTTARGSIVNSALLIQNCMSVCRFTLDGGNAHLGLGGILGAHRQFINNMRVSRCISQVEFNVANVNPHTQAMWLGGIIGFSIQQTPTEFCAAFLETLYNPTGDVASIAHGGIVATRTTTPVNEITNCYVVPLFSNPNDRPVLGGTYRKMGNNVNIHSSFFDSDVWESGDWTGLTLNDERGRTTAQLQSKQFLELQGWVFANV